MSDIGSYAMIPDSGIQVENTIISDSGFVVAGYYFVEYDHDDVFCQPGMYYNASNSIFYDDEAFTVINGINGSY